MNRLLASPALFLVLLTSMVGCDASDPASDEIVTCSESRFPVSGDRCDPDELAPGYVCRSGSCTLFCSDDCSCVDGVWSCSETCNDFHDWDCGSGPVCPPIGVGSFDFPECRPARVPDASVSDGGF